MTRWEGADKVGSATLTVPVTSAYVRDWWTTVGADPATERPEVARDLVLDLVALPGFTVAPPANGSTLQRFSVLAALGECDLTVGRLMEAHLDAAAILTELGAAAPTVGEFYGVWAAEPPGPGVTASLQPDGSWRLTGRKQWCSGAGIVTHALVTAKAGDGPRLFAVELASPAAVPVGDPWPVATLSGTDTRTVEFSDAPAIAVGGVGGYLDRPGFWWGAIGVAAVWHGGAVGLADRLQAALRRRPPGDIELAHLGAVSVAIGAGEAALRDAARRIDDEPLATDEYAVLARVVRGVVEDAALTVIDRVGRALGPGPLATDPEHARRVADLTLYLRQSHADRDLADLGRRVLDGTP